VIVAQPPPGTLDPILDSPWAGVDGLEEEVQYWLESFQGREADRFRASLVRMGRYREMVEEELALRRLPQSLAYLPIVESWYDPTAVSWVGAAGLWQFMAPTARGMGLRVNRVVDERRDPFRATPPATEFLSRLHGRFGSWFLALAAYNGGPGRLGRILDRQEPGWEGHDGLFLAVRDHLPRETRNFVPRFLAAATIARNPEAYGFGGLTPEAPMLFDEVEVPDATTLDVVAMAAGVDQEIVGILNPQLLRGFTPAGQRTLLKVPLGTGASFAEAYARIPPSERATFLEHVVASGETLTHIARDYGVSLDDLRAANPRIEPRRMQIGQRVVVPTGGSARRALGTREGAPANLEEELLIYRVRPGDTLSAIAARHRVRVGDLLRWNELSMEAIIRPGDEVKIFLPGGGG
jgi:membrane-bound lytic murein transglycosylase D